MSAGVVPTLVLASVAGSFRLTNATFMGSTTRDDIHSVTVALDRDPAHANVHTKVAHAKQERLAWTDKESVLDARPLRALVRNDAAGARNRVLLELQRRNNVRHDAITVSKVLGIPVP